MESLKEQDVEAELTARRARLQRLELEVAEERAAIALLEQTQTRTLPNLLDTLPQELRDEIWGYCVAPGKVFLSKNRIACDVRFDDFDEYEKPHWQLLAVSKVIRHEAAKVMFEQNQFIWPHMISGFGMLIKGIPSRLLSTPNDIDLNVFAQRYLRSVSMTFDLRSHNRNNPLMDVAYMRVDASKYIAPWSGLDINVRRSSAHDHLRVVAYGEVQNLLDAVLDCKALTSLELDFTNCYCPMGCCRTMYSVMDMFIDGKWPWPAYVRVLGSKNQRERSAVVESIGCLPGRPGQTTVVFEKFVVGREMQDPFYGVSPFWSHLTEEDLNVELGRQEMKVERVWEPDEDEE
ncbi:hypothetical protein CB0940_11989 [Cercospora beticola]|uniref:F-box domain-containing protein n=1 Tax=Cercospora beticola TaxID=122368 RepID=A0A2G5IEE9_CERBT|nr:hypothetical protein CB0940_11989 [Cercospora beticola]PIB03226.1 hypothetical protein CB0940_11989 [Cercospora beticola]WPB04370.1 hypothetical protein RHO25_009016 [Cercospora beticola]CAK1356805.1 unnamed protein product [Cercospora beticola]